MKLKKSIFLLLGLLILQRSAMAHELNFGLFDLFEKDQTYFMEIRLDRANLIKAVGTQVGRTKEDWNCALSQYMNENMNLAINGIKASIEYREFSFLEDVIVIQAQLDIPHQIISEIKVENTILLETIESQTNIIKASFHEKKRSFRLNKDRISTIIKYEL
ncbi:MAG: DUF6702 family protein [Reichenbachiella sp.]|uniref:DUF6702 family protein n=1 Tax=Reichenbachiella sp. TaxID=2184521 RepID=UPI003297F8E4